MEKFRKILPVILAVLLVAALGVTGWLLTDRAALQQRVEALEAGLAAEQQTTADVQATLTGTQGELSDTNAQLTTTESDLAAAQATLAETQSALTTAEAALAEMTAAKDAADALNTALTQELEACQAQLEAVTAEKETADAALAALGWTRVQPQVVESMTDEDPADDVTVEETPADDTADEVPVDDVTVEETPVDEVPADEAPETDVPAAESGEEFFSDAPVDADAAEAQESPAPATVMTADQLGVAFEAPVDWIILTEDEENRFVMRAQESHDGVYASLVIRRADDMEEVPDIPSADGSVMIDLMGKTGLDADHAALNEEGASGLFRACAVVVDGKAYCVSVMACRACFDQVMNDIFLPLCGSLRLIP